APGLQRVPMRRFQFLLIGRTKDPPYGAFLAPSALDRPVPNGPRTIACKPPRVWPANPDYRQNCPPSPVGPPPRTKAAGHVGRGYPPGGALIPSEGKWPRAGYQARRGICPRLGFPFR